MNLVVESPVWLMALLLVALAAAAIEDAIRLRISNATCAAVLVAGLVAMGYRGFPIALWENVVVFVVVLVVGTFAFGRGWLGGGDVKLLAALGLWVDLRGATLMLGLVFLAGGVVAVMYLVARAISRRPVGTSGHSGHIPYGLAITAGALIAFGIQTTHHRPTSYQDIVRLPIKK